jgi:ATP-dependent helicase/nuclease subunit B
MLHILLSPVDGGTAWRHLLAPGEARAGFQPVGPLGLTKRLGGILGIPAELATGPQRLAAYTQRLDQHDDHTRSYSASRKQDPFGVARYLLSLRDGLHLSGWGGGALHGSERLRDLSALERIELPIPPGLPEVVADLLGGLKAAGTLPFPVHVDLAAPRRAFPPLFRRLLDAMAGAGATVAGAPPPVALAPPTTDLGRLQRSLLEPTGEKARLAGDGSFLLLEADTPIEAAELTASLARTLPLADTTFVVPTEPACLDAAMARQGLPTLGRSSSSHLRPHLQVLPLRLALAFRPQDPFRAAELLLLPGGPLPGHARRMLLGALSQMPGIGSQEWKDAIESAVADEMRYASERGESDASANAAGADLREKIDAWFGGELFDPLDGVPAAKAASIASFVATWAGGRVRGSIDQAAADPDSADPGDAPLWAHAAAVARTLEHLLIARPPGEKMSQQKTLQLHETAVGDGSDLAAFPGESGRPALVGAPGSVTTPSAGVVWWGFVLDADPGHGPDPWTGAEREALVASGVTLPDPGERRGIEADDWRRPVLAARQQAVLVRWRLAGAEPVPPHALLDELSTRVAEGSLASCTVTSERLLGGSAGTSWTATITPVPPATVMVQRPAWSVPAETLAPLGNLSASSLSSYLGCPFQWALHYQAKLLPGEGVDLPEGNRLLGDFTHRVLQDMLCSASRLVFATATPEDARAWAAKAFDERVGVEAATLVRRGAEVELERARTLVGNAAVSLLAFLRATGWSPVDAEREVKGTFGGLPATGYVDLVVEKGGKEALVDLKLSGLKYRQEELESGHALQIALYASLLRRKGKPLPPSGFFILDDGQLLTTDPGAFPGAIVVDGPGPAATLEGADTGFRFWRSVMAKGILPVLHEDLAWEGPVTAAVGTPPEDGSPARPPAPCRFCDYRSLCVPPAVDDEEEES